MYISAYFSSLGLYLDKKSRMNTCAHSMHSLIATNTLLRSCESTLICCLPDSTAISSKEAIALASTRPLDSLVTKIQSKETRLLVSASLGAISNTFGILNTAVFLTQGSSSLRAAFKGSTRYQFSFGTLKELIVLTAKARIIGLDLLAASFLKEEIVMIA